jgi:hypothetical protein
VQQQPFLDLRGQGVIIGFVDTGIDYTLPIFRYADGTSKILYIYDQTATGTPPEGFPIGTEYTNEQINTALTSENPFEVVPENDNPTGHGTFLASVAAGSDVDGFTSAAPDADIIMVKLRRASSYYLERNSIPADQPNAFESSSVMLGVEYILKKAQQTKRPVVICIGLGTNQFGHDGFSLFEEYLSSVASVTGVCLCVAGGNESQARHHTKGAVKAVGETASIDIKVDQNGGDIIVSIWNYAENRLSVSVRSPLGGFVARLPARPNESQLTELILEQAQVLVEYYFPIETTGSQVTIVKVTNATEGIWTITVYGDIVLDGEFNAWLPITGFCPPGIEFIAPDPYTTITVPGTIPAGICIGAYDSSKNSLYSQSSWGPSLMYLLPDFVAPGVRIGGYYPDGPGVMSGTSVATAMTAGASALMMQWGIVEGNDPNLSSYQIRAYMIRGANRIENVPYPNNQWGYGSLNLIKAFRYMREL